MFDKKYFNSIWGSVHRHDYCENLANQIIDKYHPKSVLDIGTGCGELVRVLRERGVDAYGLEISKYAVDNSHGHVKQGDVRDIPYDQKFDVVFSQGLWCHIPEEDLDKAWAECLRVGKYQEHYIDYEDPGAPHFITEHSEEWWNERLPGIAIKEYPRVLIACPTHELKEYAMQEWIDCVEAIEYPNKDILLVDNSPNENFYNRWKDKVPMVYLPDLDQSEVASARINASMMEIRRRFLDNNLAWWFNLEIDVIPPPEILTLLLKYPSDWTSHDYEVRGGGGRMTGIGCSLLSRSLVEAVNWASNVHGPDHEAWMQTQNTHKTLTLTNWLAVKHIGDGNGYGG